MDLDVLFFHIDNFVKALDRKNKFFLISKTKRRGYKPKMNLSELMTIMVWYHHSNFKNFKSFYYYLLTYHKKDFNKIISYSRFVEWMPYLLLPMSAFLKTNFGKSTGISFVDSTPLKVCHNKRINRNKVFKGIATRGRSSMGWFYGFKLHLVVNHQGDLLSFTLTKGNVDDRVPVKNLCKEIFGKLYGDKGYISNKLFKDLFSNGVELITNVKSNTKNKFIKYSDKIMLRKRFLIETINDQLKNVCDIEHSRHRSPINFLLNIVSALVAYTFKKNKPSIKGLDFALVK